MTTPVLRGSPYQFPQGLWLARREGKWRFVGRVPACLVWDGTEEQIEEIHRAGSFGERFANTAAARMGVQRITIESKEHGLRVAARCGVRVDGISERE